MPDLEEQLRAYRRVLDQNAAATGPTGRSASHLHRAGPRRASGRSSWVLVAAATAGLVMTVSLLLPPAGHEGELMNRKGSGWGIGLCLFAAACTTGQGPDATTADSTTVSSTTPGTSSPSRSGAPLLFEGSGSVEPGTYTVDRYGTPIQVTVPAGWQRSEHSGVAIGGPDQSFLAFFDVAEVFADACNYIDNRVAIGPTVQDMVAALVAQKNTETSDPRPIEVDGFAGSEIVISPPADLDLATCYGGTTMAWIDENSSAIDGPSEAVTVRVLDLNGQRAVITAGSYEPMSAATRSELDAMVDSFRIG